MKITCNFESELEEDTLFVQQLLKVIEFRLNDLGHVLEYKKLSEKKLNDLFEEQESCNHKLNALQNAKNIQNLYRSELKLQKEHTGPFEFRKRHKIHKELKTIRENKSHIREIKHKTQAQLESIGKAIERRTSLNTAKIISNQTLSLTRHLYDSINDYRIFRNYFFETYGLTLPRISLSDMIERTEGKNITILDYHLPIITIDHILPEENLIDSYEENGVIYTITE